MRASSKSRSYADADRSRRRGQASGGPRKLASGLLGGGGLGTSISSGPFHGLRQRGHALGESIDYPDEVQEDFDRNDLIHHLGASRRDNRHHLARADLATVEKCLAHEVGTKVTQAYDRSDRYDLRVPLMQAWAAYVMPTETEVDVARGNGASPVDVGAVS